MKKNKKNKKKKNKKNKKKKNKKNERKIKLAVNKKKITKKLSQIFHLKSSKFPNCVKEIIQNSKKVSVLQ